MHCFPGIDFLQLLELFVDLTECRSMGNPSTNDFEPDMRPLRLRQRKVAPTPTLSMLNSDVIPTFTAAGPSVDTQ